MPSRHARWSADPCDYVIEYVKDNRRLVHVWASANVSPARLTVAFSVRLTRPCTSSSNLHASSLLAPLYEAHRLKIASILHVRLHLQFCVLSVNVDLQTGWIDRGSPTSIMAWPVSLFSGGFSPEITKPSSEQAADSKYRPQSAPPTVQDLLKHFEAPGVPPPPSARVGDPKLKQREKEPMKLWHLWRYGAFVAMKGESLWHMTNPMRGNTAIWRPSTYANMSAPRQPVNCLPPCCHTTSAAHPESLGASR